MTKLWLHIIGETYYFAQFSLRRKRIQKSSKSTKEFKNDVENNRTVYIDRFWSPEQNTCLTLVLQTTKYDLTDYNWNERVNHLVRERCELDNALSWLSTLGGAFSALGDYFPNCAHTAGKISYHQLNLALRLGDPNIAARCRLYFSLSLIQQRRYKVAQSIIRREYHNAANSTVIDNRLLNMCKGIWAKLQYEHYLYKKSKTKR